MASTDEVDIEMANSSTALTSPAPAPAARASSGGGLSLAMVSKLKVKSKRATEAIRRRRQNYAMMEQDPASSSTLSVKVKNSYCAPTFSTLPVITLLAVYVNLFYEKLGANLAYMSFFIALARSFDVITDPLMSFVTDSCRSKWGRRRPFCATGCVPYALFLILLLTPPHLGSTAMSMWFGMCYIAFFLCNTYTNIPYDALGPELTDNYEDRSRLFFVSGLYDGFGALVAMIIPVMLSTIVSWSTWNEDTCDSQPYCYDSGGTGRSCVADPGTGKYDYYDLTMADNGTMWSPGAYVIETCLGNTDVDEDAPGISAYCECMDACDAACDLANERTAFMMVGVFFGSWYVLTMLNCVRVIRERSQLEHAGAMPAPQPLVPSLLNTLSNSSFVVLLPAWACDAVVNAIIASMLTYYIRYVVQPEFQTEEENGIDCNGGVAVEGEDSESWVCSSSSVLGAAVTALLVCAFLGTPVWLFITSKIGKRKAWLLWSFVMATTNIVFLAVGPGDVSLAIAIAGFNGLPFGAKFLADAILADIIDYDEFLSGARNEATYTMFKSFLPKICAIPAAAVPIALLNTFGHVAPIDGRVQPQPDSVYNFCVTITVIVPTCLSLLGFMIKLRFPLRSQDQVDKISVGVGKHMLGDAAEDPVSGLDYKLMEVADEERDQVDLLNNFTGVEPIETLLTDQGAETLLIRTERQRNYSALLLFVMIIASGATFDLLENDTISFIPVLCIIGFGVGLTCTLFAILRCRAARALVAQPADREVLEKVLANRQILRDMAEKGKELAKAANASS